MTERLTDEQVAVLADFDANRIHAAGLWNGDRDCVKDDVTEALAVEVQQARELLRELEWTEAGACVSCSRWQRYGHRPDCAYVRLGLSPAGLDEAAATAKAERDYMRGIRD
jgi:hypothetical protein